MSGPKNSMYYDQSTKLEVRSSKLRAKRTMCKDQSSSLKDQSSKCKDSTKFDAQSTKHKSERVRLNALTSKSKAKSPKMLQDFVNQLHFWQYNNVWIFCVTVLVLLLLLFILQTKPKPTLSDSFKL